MRTVLVVEDEAFLALELKSVLESEGFRVLTAWSLDAALPLVESGVPSLAVIDLGLPAASDGSAVARALAERGIPLLVCSGLSVAEARQALGDVQAVGVFTKPVHPDDVLAAVRSTLAA